MNKDRILGIVRHALTFGGGYLVSKYGSTSGVNVDELVGAAITLIGGVWSIVSKSKTPTAPGA